jgi:hypothetical protein
MNRVRRSENTVAMFPILDGVNPPVPHLLFKLLESMDWTVQVVLDVGAQILELTNLQFAQQWLEMIPSMQRKEAAIYFDEEDNMCVVDKRGFIEQLHVSPYFEKLDVCLVYMDEAHTRGTDLKLPESYRAAVTLGPLLTKDKLVQGMYGGLINENF